MQFHRIVSIYDTINQQPEAENKMFLLLLLFAQEKMENGMHWQYAVCAVCSHIIEWVIGTQKKN